jgi:hypothetical protein
VTVRHVSASADGGLMVAGTLRLPDDRARYFAVRLDESRSAAWTWNFAPPAALKAEVREATPDGDGGLYLTGTGGTVRLNADGQVQWYQRWPGVCVAVDTAGRVRIGGALEETFSWGVFEGDGTPVHFDQWRFVIGTMPYTRHTSYVAWGQVDAGVLDQRGVFYLWGWHDKGFSTGMGTWYLGTAGIGGDGQLVFGQPNLGSMPYPLYYGPGHPSWRLIGAVAHPEEGAWMLGRMYLGDGTKGTWLVRTRENNATWHPVESSDDDDDWRFHQLAAGSGTEVWVVGHTPVVNYGNPGVILDSPYVARFSGDGNPIWKRSYPRETDARQEAQALAISGDDHAYVGGVRTTAQSSLAFVMELSVASGDVDRRLIHEAESGVQSSAQVVVSRTDGGCWVLGEVKDATGTADLLVWQIAPR